MTPNGESGLAKPADLTVVLDSCALAEAAVSDLYLRLAEEPRLLLPRWTDEIWAEVHRTWLDKLGWDHATADRRRDTILAVFPEARIEGYEPLIEQCANDPKDRHVLAAAIRAKVPTIVTFNRKHFKPEALAPWGIVATHPAAHLTALHQHDSDAVLDRIRQIGADRHRSVELVLARLAWAVPAFTAHVARAIQVEVPRIAPAEWKASRPAPRPPDEPETDAQD